MDQTTTPVDVTWRFRNRDGTSIESVLTEPKVPAEREIKTHRDRNYEVVLVVRKAQGLRDPFVLALEREAA
jgi:hypothetical protein